MKTIKCPNCGARMLFSSGTWATRYRGVSWCDACDVCGPSAYAPTLIGAKRAAIRLMREWIARMEADKRDTETVRDVIRAWMDEHADDFNHERANIVCALRDFADRIERKEP